MKYVLASKNAHKAEEIRAILGAGYEIITQSDAGAGEIEVIEDGKTFEENAVKKAVQIMQATGMPAIADDSGLSVDALGGAPGIYSARFAGERATDEENLQKLLRELEGVTADKRGAKFVCVIAVAVPDSKEVKLYRGECKGRILTEKRGENGFGYDPIFYVDKYDCSMAQLEAHIKNAISHRSNALRLLCKGEVSEIFRID